MGRIGALKYPKEKSIRGFEIKSEELNVPFKPAWGVAGFYGERGTVSKTQHDAEQAAEEHYPAAPRIRRCMRNIQDLL